jgi:hypothetical protein
MSAPAENGMLSRCTHAGADGWFLQHRTGGASPHLLLAPRPVGLRFSLPSVDYDRPWSTDGWREHGAGEEN